MLLPGRGASMGICSACVCVCWWKSQWDAVYSPCTARTRKKNKHLTVWKINDSPPPLSLHSSEGGANGWLHVPPHGGARTQLHSTPALVVRETCSRFSPDFSSSSSCSRSSSSQSSSPSSSPQPPPSLPLMSSCAPL